MKYLLLEILKDGPRHGYEMITELETRHRGYRPSAGSVYPTLQMLDEGGFVTSAEIDGKKVYTITEKGLELLKERGEKRYPDLPDLGGAFEIWGPLGKLASAVTEGAWGTDEKSLEKIIEILNKARKEVYAVLADS
jgi:DNA-binding PadR family transcriptional regulator